MLAEVAVHVQQSFDLGDPQLEIVAKVSSVARGEWELSFGLVGSGAMLHAIEESEAMNLLARLHRPFPWDALGLKVGSARQPLTEAGALCCAGLWERFTRRPAQAEENTLRPGTWLVRAIRSDRRDCTYDNAFLLVRDVCREGGDSVRIVLEDERFRLQEAIREKQ